jgi:hypothetical protein
MCRPKRIKKGDKEVICVCRKGQLGACHEELVARQKDLKGEISGINAGHGEFEIRITNS